MRVRRAGEEVNCTNFSQRVRASRRRVDADSVVVLRPRALWWIFSAACGGAPADTTIDIVHDVCAPITLAVNAPTDAQRAGIAGALALWRRGGVGTMSIVDDAAAGAGAIEIRFETAGLPFHGLYDDETGIVYINRAIEDLTPLSIVIAHELGHSFGLPHIGAAERRSLMNPGNLVTPPTAEDGAAIEALWGRCEEAPP
jgi:hypothetical protein